MAMPLASNGTNKRFDTEYYVEGYATTFDKPYLMFEYEGIKYYEVIDRHALDEADMSDVIMQYDHQGRCLRVTPITPCILKPTTQVFSQQQTFQEVRPHDRCMRKSTAVS